MKYCHHCQKELPAEQFSEHLSRRDGLRTECKKCVQTRSRSFDGKLKAMFNNQQTNSRSRGHVAPTYTLAEFVAWAVKNGYPDLYENWVLLDYSKDKAPSADRLDDAHPYSLTNLRLTTWETNNRKAHEDRVTGKLVVNHTPVNQLTLDREYVASFPSQRAAHVATGISQGNIGMVCKGQRGSAGGYIWEYM